MSGSIDIIYFAWVRERLGLDGEHVSFGGDVQTVSDILALLSDKSATHAEVLSEVDKLRFALDQDYRTPSSLVGSAKELAIFPPVTGG